MRELPLDIDTIESVGNCVMEFISKYFNNITNIKTYGIGSGNEYCKNFNNIITFKSKVRNANDYYLDHKISKIRNHLNKMGEKYEKDIIII